jgi:hypothetical protein
MDNNQNNNMNQTVDSQVNENFNQQPMPTQEYLPELSDVLFFCP